MDAGFIRRPSSVLVLISQLHHVRLALRGFYAQVLTPPSKTCGLSPIHAWMQRRLSRRRGLETETQKATGKGG